jgi:iron complex outermembrane receptor protein
MYGDPVNGCYVSTTGATFRFLGSECFVKEWPTWDVGLAYKGIRNLTLGVLVRNVRDTPAPYDPNVLQTGFNTNMHNPYGRFFQFTINYKFR